MKLVAAVIGSGLIALLILLTYRYAWRISRWVGQRWMVIVVRLSAFILMCIGIEFLWSGYLALKAAHEIN